MRNAFPSYYRPSIDELRDLWSDAIFIFDANVLLDLHRYSKTTRDEFLSVLNKICERVWIPHHVGLEYQENRLNVIAEQERRYENATQVLDTAIKTLEDGLSQLNLKKSHSPVDPRPTIEKLNATLQPFRDQLEELKKVQPKIGDEDPIRNQLDTIFEGCVGKGPSTQQELDDIYAEGKVRYDRRMPPGYKDQGKGKSTSTQSDDTKEKEGFFHNGLFYQREFAT